MALIEQNNVKKVYDEIATHFDVTRYSVWIDVKKFLDKLPKNSLILDAGCGNGKNMYRKDCLFIGGDFCHKFAEITSNKGLESLVFNTKNLPFNSYVFDHSISIAVIHHIYEKQERIMCIKELVRVTKVDGFILISVWGKHGKYNYGNNYIKWQLQSKYDKSKKSDSNKSFKTYQRFYYLYKENELLDDINEHLDNVSIESHYSSFNNRFIVLKKIK